MFPHQLPFSKSQHRLYYYLLLNNRTDESTSFGLWLIELNLYLMPLRTSTILIEVEGCFSCSLIVLKLLKGKWFEFCFLGEGSSLSSVLNDSLLNISIWRGLCGIMQQIPLASLWTEFLVPNTGRCVCCSFTPLKGLNKWFFDACRLVS